MDIVWTVLNHLLPVLLAVGGIFGVFLAQKLLAKMGVQRNEAIDKFLDKSINTAINFAEVAARKHLVAQGEALSSENKMAKAVGVVMTELKQAGLTKVAQDLIVARIESALEVGGHGPGVAVDNDPKV
jgi:hypothetical protein